MTIYLQTDRVTLHHGRAEDVYPTLDPGFSLAILDGPYGIGKDEWDRMGIDGLAEWYAPHLAEVSRLCAPSASLYLWNTAEGWARLDPVVRGCGWTFRALVTWDKGIGSLAGRIDTEAMRAWPDVTEVCGFYQREGWSIFDMARDATTAHNTAASFLRAERERSGMTRKLLSTWFPSRTGGLTGCVTNWEEGYNFPTWEVWETCHRALNAAGAGRPYLQRDRSRVYDLDNRAEYEALRAEYEALRAPFRLPPGITNVWAAGQVQGQERLRDATRQPLHPCQKPLLFADRMIRASSRPGDRVLAPFGGTCREALACHRLPPDDARSCVTVEMDRKYLDAVRGCFTLDLAPRRREQVALFGSAS